jgi:DNA-binding NarL/FixJ family response regulator
VIAVADSTYTVTFVDHRIGSHDDVQPLTVTAVSANDLAARVCRHARPLLVSGDVLVDVDLVRLRGWITAGAHDVAEFTITAPLTGQERTVAELAAGGVTNHAIAKRLYITVSTVEQHLTRTYRKTRTDRVGLREWLATNPAVAS